HIPFAPGCSPPTPPPQSPPPRLLPQVSEEQLGHCTEEADMHRRDLATYGNREQLDASESSAVVKFCNIRKLAPKPVERLDHNHVETMAGNVPEELLISRAEAAGAAYRSVG